MQKRHRIFIAINLPSDVKRVLAKYGKKFTDLPAKWVPEQNLHITLEFLGGLYDHELPQAIERAKEIAAGMKPFEVHLDKVGYAPEGKIPPKMLWATADKMHVTLARILTTAWRQINPEERPEVGENIDLLFSVESIEVMESEPSKGAPKYTILESIPLQ